MYRIYTDEITLFNSMFIKKMYKSTITTPVRLLGIIIMCLALNQDLAKSTSAIQWCYCLERHIVQWCACWCQLCSVVGFDHGAPCRVKNMARGTQ